MKTIILVKSTNDKSKKVFKRFVDTRWIEKSTYECSKDVVCVGMWLGDFFRSTDKELLVIHNPTEFCLTTLVDMDKMQSVFDFDLYRVYLGDDELPENYDFIVSGDKDTIINKLNYIFDTQG